MERLRVPSLHRLGALVLGAVLAALSLAGCQVLNPVPPVDLADTTRAQPVKTAPRAQPVNGSLFSASAYRPAFEDPRARQPGDSLTIQITENVSASQKSTASIDRSGEVEGGVSALLGMTPANLARTRAAGSSSNTFSGKGDTASSNTFSGSITTSVIEVLPNGHLVVAGEKQIGVNANVDVLRFTGTVDPKFIQPGNVVASTQVANARIESRSRGQQGEALSIGWLARFFLSVMPF